MLFALLHTECTDGSATSCLKVMQQEGHSNQPLSTCLKYSSILCQMQDSPALLHLLKSFSQQDALFCLASNGKQRHKV